MSDILHRGWRVAGTESKVAQQAQIGFECLFCRRLAIVQPVQTSADIIQDSGEQLALFNIYRFVDT